MSSQRAVIDTLRTLAEASIGASYTAVGSPTTDAVRIICFTNATDAPMYFSDDGVNNKLYIASGAFKLFDITTNRNDKGGDGVDLAFPANTQYYVKYASTPSTGAVFIEIIYGG